MRENRTCVPLCDDRADSDEHPLPVSGHVWENCPIHPENRENVRVEGSLDLFEGQFQRRPLRSIQQVIERKANLNTP
jgi:hypothetical protein